MFFFFCKKRHDPPLKKKKFFFFSSLVTIDVKTLVHFASTYRCRGFKLRVFPESHSWKTSVQHFDGIEHEPGAWQQTNSYWYGKN